jgi:hypothetical protein
LNLTGYPSGPTFQTNLILPVTLLTKYSILEIFVVFPLADLTAQNGVCAGLAVGVGVTE